jgi:hypothetical protein
MGAMRSVGELETHWLRVPDRSAAARPVIRVVRVIVVIKRQNQPITNVQ